MKYLPRFIVIQIVGWALNWERKWKKQSQLALSLFFDGHPTTCYFFYFYLPSGIFRLIDNRVCNFFFFFFHRYLLYTYIHSHLSHIAINIYFPWKNIIDWLKKISEKVNNHNFIVQHSVHWKIDVMKNKMTLDYYWKIKYNICSIGNAKKEMMLVGFPRTTQ